jgi:hypothetical protein
MRLCFCAACGATSDLHMCHLVPVAAGGAEAETNLVTLCHKCHALIHERSDFSTRELVREGQRRAKSIDRETKMAIQVDLRSGAASQRQIAKNYNVSPRTVRRFNQELRLCSRIIRDPVEHSSPMQARVTKTAAEHIYEIMQQSIAPESHDSIAIKLNKRKVTPPAGWSRWFASGVIQELAMIDKVGHGWGANI